MMRLIGFVVLLFADRFRGRSGMLPKQIKRSIEAIAVTLCVGITVPWHIALVTLLVFLGICLGGYGNVIAPAVTGTPMAKAKTTLNPGPEKWQYGIFLRNVWLACVAVGIIWGSPSLLAYSLEPKVIYILIAFMVAFPASCYLALLIGRRFPKLDTWVVQQYLFGPITALILVSA